MNTAEEWKLEEHGLIFVQVATTVGLLYQFSKEVSRNGNWEYLAPVRQAQATPKSSWFGTEFRYPSSGDSFTTKRCVLGQGTKVCNFPSSLKVVM